MKRFLFAVLAALSPCLVPADDTGSNPFATAYVKAELNRDYPSFFKCGEEIVCNYSIVNVTGPIDPKRHRVLEMCDRDGDVEQRKANMFVPEANKTYTIRTKLDHPGVVRFWVEVWDVVKDRKVSRIDSHGRAVRFFKTAFVEPEKMQSVPEPADYDAFWKRHRAELDAVPMNPKLESAAKGDGFQTYRLRLDCAGPAPVTGFISIPTKPGKYPAHLMTDGYGGPFSGSGAQSRCEGANPDEIVIHINAHGYELGRDRQYYIDFMKNAEEHGYKLYKPGNKADCAAKKQPNLDPDKCYFAGMTWRIMRALDYVKTRPEWNGRDLYATGVSQGGLQTIWAAGLDPQVSWASVQVPWSCEFGGRETLNRIECRLPIAETPALRYYDPVNMAKRIRSSFDIARAGLADYTSPPSGIQVFYNNLKGPKRVIWYDRMEHKQMPFIRHRFFEESHRLNELVTGFPEGRWNLAETRTVGKKTETATGGALEVKKLPDGHYRVLLTRPGKKTIDFSEPKYEADVNLSAGELTVRYRADELGPNVRFEDTETAILSLRPHLDGSVTGDITAWYGNERAVNGIWKVGLRGAPALAAAPVSSNTVRQPLWPEGKIPNFQADQIAAPREEVCLPGFDRAAHRMPYLEWSAKPAQPNGACMILISGGGYDCTCDGPKFKKLEAVLLENGVTCVWLWYRTPRPQGREIYASAWEDGQRAVRLVRSQAQARGFDPERIGVLGCSAGSHLSLLLATSSSANVYAKVDATDDVPCHVNWAVPMCPAYVLTDGLLGQNTRDGDAPDVKLSSLFRFDAKTCPMCFFHGGNDIYSPNGSTQLYRQLRRLKIPAELHLDPDRGHGPVGPKAFVRAIEFMRQMGFFGPVGQEVDLMTRFPGDSARAESAKEDVWPEGQMPDKQAHQCKPTIEWHIPKTLKTKAIQIIYSGGSYEGNGTGGFEVAPARRFLNEKGVTVVTMTYRTPRPRGGLQKHVTAWQDLQRAIRLVRHGAPSRGLDPDRIGIMGSSAGGHLTLMGATSSRHRAYWPIDELDKIPCNVQWAVAIYPAYALTDGGERPNAKGGNEDDARPVPEFSFDLDTCPILFIHGDKDGWAAMNSVKCWEQLRRMGIQGELHTLATRSHCFQRKAAPGTGSYTWLDRIWEFMETKGIDR